ncbi:hypothetical protein HDU87_005807 [Geranomyces variabilis]|uniref:Uncharacterized protein n=1 Tax=Geranomyces variabilis TaxID=109894 RepID=A0AAD5XNR2_9FUNG|nr:hypothetical protein HDU87_005807 [Geranomyces variabilis]
MRAVISGAILAVLFGGAACSQSGFKTLYEPELQHGVSLLQDVTTGRCEIVNAGPAQPFRSGPVRKRAARREETRSSHSPKADGEDHSALEYVEIVAETEELAVQHAKQLCFGGLEDLTASEEEDLATGTAEMDVINFIYNGAPANRIDIVLMGDGYTADDRMDFEADMNRLVADMWAGDTFKHILPLMNVWGIFAPGVDRGIGVGGKPKDTPFGLYRDGTELRGIYCSKPYAARKACKLTGPAACDYPSLIGNDDFYGGLGGEFVISTRSNASGTVVLRHEMGHNLVHVGEEYDGGQVYSGCNAERSLKNMKWEKWFTDSPVKEQRSVVRVQDYSWYDLSKGAYSIHFRSDGAYERWLLKISASGVEIDSAMEVFLDGKALEWKSSGILDRGFYEWADDDAGLSDGDHTLVFKLGTPPEKNAPIRQLCSVSLVELGEEAEYNTDLSFISAYPTISQSGKKTYRPTHEACLMRNMARPTFCPVCQEGLWINLMSQLSVIERVETSCRDGRTTLNVVPLPLAQFRESGDLGRDVEWYTVRWYTRASRDEHQADEVNDYREGAVDGGLKIQAAFSDGPFYTKRKDGWLHKKKLDDMFTAEVKPGLWKMEVRFHTIDVRLDLDDVLLSTWHGRVDDACT